MVENTNAVNLLGTKVILCSMHCFKVQALLNVITGFRNHGGTSLLDWNYKNKQYTKFSGIQGNSRHWNTVRPDLHCTLSMKKSFQNGIHTLYHEYLLRQFQQPTKPN
jgi:hypothetical protein